MRGTAAKLAVKGQSAASHRAHQPARGLQMRRARRGDEETGGEVDGDLGEHDRVVVLHAEEAEAEDEKKRIAGEADEGGVDVRSVAQAIDAVEHPVLRDVAVDEGVAFDFGVRVDEPEAQGGSGGEGQREEPPLFGSRGHWNH